MRSLSRLFCSAATITLAFSLTAGASTLTLVPNASSPSYPGSAGTGPGYYPASDAIDTGSNRYVTDYASNGLGANTHLDFAITGATNHINVVDRTTSGAGNGAFVGGLYDYTTSFELIFSDHSDFSSPINTFTFMKGDPAVHTSPADFLFSANFALTNADFVRYQVMTTNGLNPGVADIAFTTTPEPGSLALLGTGALGLAGFARRRFADK